MKLGISEAARRAGVGRQTLYRKIESGALSKEIGAEGKPVIDLSELSRLYPQVVAAATMRQPASDTADIQKTGRSDNLLQAELAAARHRIQELEADRTDLRAERDKLLSVVQEQATSMRLLTDQSPRKRGWLSRLIGR